MKELQEDKAGMMNTIRVLQVVRGTPEVAASRELTCCLRLSLSRSPASPSQDELQGAAEGVGGGGEGAAGSSQAVVQMRGELVGKDREIQRLAADLEARLGLL